MKRIIKKMEMFYIKKRVVIHIILPGKACLIGFMLFLSKMINLPGTWQKYSSNQPVTSNQGQLSGYPTKKIKCQKFFFFSIALLFCVSSSMANDLITGDIRSEYDKYLNNISVAPLLTKVKQSETKRTLVKTIPEKKKMPGISILAAVESTIAKHPDIMVYKEKIEDSLGGLQSEKGAFDVKLETMVGHSHEIAPTYTRDRILDPSKKRETENTAYSINFSKKYRTGIEVSSGISVNRNELSVDPYYATVADDFDDPTYDGNAKFVINIPLLKGFGKIPNTANEIVAEREHKISLYELRRTISKNIFDTVVAYWEYLSAARSLEQLNESERRLEDFVRKTKFFIAAGQKPASDLEQILASLADKISRRIAVEQEYFQAKIKMGLSMGLSIDEIKKFDSPVDDFYKFDQIDLLELVRGSDRLINESVQRREEYLISLEKQKQNEILLKTAKNSLLPQLDFNSSLGYSGLDEGDSASNYISSLEKNNHGLNYSIKINCEYYFGNNKAKGLLRRRESQYRQTVIDTDDITRKISANILVSLSDLRKSALRLGATSKAVNHYTAALKDEKKKLKLGKSTLFDVLQKENLLTQSQLEDISAQLKHSFALAQLYFNTGSFLDPDQNRFSVALFKKPKDLFDFGL